MTVEVFPLALESMLQNGMDDLLSNDVVAVAVDSSFTYDGTWQQYASDLSGLLGSPSAPVTSKAVTGGVFTCDPPTITGTSAGDVVVGIAFYVNDGGSNPLLCFINETGGGAPLSYSSDGSDFVVNLTGGNQVFSI